MAKEKSAAEEPPNSPHDGLEIAGLYADIRQALIRSVRRYLKRTPHDVEDVVQEAFIRAIETQRDRYVHSPKAFLYRATRNLALNAIEKSAYKLTDALGDLLPEAVISEAPSAEDQFETRERFELLCRAIRHLPARRRRVFVLRRVYGLSQKEIAERMSISLKTVEAHLATAMVQVTDYMEVVEGSTSDRRGRRRSASRKG
jgi:RNA polymerase sigma-70 factor (ECF subfamily)